jgi:ketosteroid isomerase-like protein
MRCRLIPLILMLVLAPATQAWSATAAPAADELKQLLKYFLEGASRNDVAVHDRFWADDLIYTRSAGVRVGKADILANAGTPEAAEGPPTVYTAEDIRIQQYGDTAVVAFRLVGTTGNGPQAEVTQFLNTGTFAKRNGEWRAVAWQATRMAEASDSHSPRPEPQKEAAINLTPGAVARPGLYDEILKADTEFFKAFFDACDVETVRRYIADDFEMFHDKGGLVSSSGAEFVKITQDKCKRQAEGTDFLSARKLVPESMKVYALNNYGAIQVGTHRFYAVQKDKPDRLTETGLFTHVWKEENGQWKLARVLSYDHVLAQ